ncbi:PREDICTED: DEAD-box ATP-dependent RNA helicase 42 [Fragaria vesca subsp. vesca]|uniref:DEAD-box ATP-dependent RNA helicase 42 n=1 Tax=Fragaria vesca subsp. vesca TaxID=101020 RepID=UPI0002C2EE23|nr:PREDICTED: DEAD-box ATP-dependent RNA helicase 42 [Fragaria vesca subsp. vesca]
MAKSSSSHRKKRDKISSKAQTKKRSKSKTNSKSDKYRSKKVCRRDDSLSFSDEDDSRSLSSSFSSEDGRRSRRARSRTRRDVKGSKKRARKRSYSSDSSEESPRPRAKKRKASKKYEAKKRSRSRDKPRRNARTSSVSSESRSCSTCQGGGISGDEIESKRHRSRLEKRMREGTDRNKVESGTERSRYRSRSRSLCRNYGESDCQSQERVSGEGNGRRLRSVIAVSKEDNEGRWLDEVGHKEEITYDHDDYPSCRSNDSNDGGSKRELDNHLQVASEVRMRVESAKEEGALVSDAEIMRLPSSGNICDRDDGGQAEGINSSCDETRITDHVNENKISGEISSLKDEDLETVLRQKALENLKRFRGKPQKIAVTGDKEDKKQPPGAKAESVQLESPKVGGGARMLVVKSSKEDISENDQTRLVEGTNGSPARDSICLSEIFEKELIRKNGRDETVSAKQDVVCPTHQEAVSGSSKMASTTPDVDKPNLAAPKSTSSSLKPHSILKRALASLQHPQDRLLVTKSSVDNTVFGTAQSVTQSSNNDGLDISNGSGSTGPEPSGENRSDLQQDEAKDGLQFEQKTMSVMRGSEIVQVSYKVYIPKKAPALARRQLKR